MATQLTAEDARQSLTAHVEAKGIDVFVKYGAQFDAATLQRLLADRTVVRYSCELAFDAGKLIAGELAHPELKGDGPEQGFVMYVQPALASQWDRVAAAVLYQLVVVNYGEFASLDEAETFGAAALGLTRDEYYAMLCEIADGVSATADTSHDEHGCGGHHDCGGHCSCG